MSAGVILHQTWLLVRNDLRQESRKLELLLSSVFFTVVLLVIFGLSFIHLPDREHFRAVPGMLWIGVAFVGVLTLTRLFERERESKSLEALLASPIERVSIYFSKCTTTLLVLTICGALWIPGLLLLFPGAAAFAEQPLATGATFLLGCLGYCSVGTLFAAGLAIGGSKNVLLSVVLYPLTTPVLLLSLTITQRILESHPEVWKTIAQLGALDVLLILLAAWMFEALLVGAPNGEKAKRSTARRSAQEVG